jgi:hypothetical protein
MGTPDRSRFERAARFGQRLAELAKENSAPVAGLTATNADGLLASCILQEWPAIAAQRHQVQRGSALE